MHRLFYIVVTLACAVVADAQTTFLDNLTKQVSGQGTVTITQDQRLTDIINGKGRHQATPSTDDKSQQKITDDESVVQTGKKTKVRGFRIQIYWGGSQRVHQAKAQQAAEKVSALFPEYQTYTSFESPHWRCRVGDFTDRQKAWEALQKLREAGIGADAMIVRSEIYIYQ